MSGIITRNDKQQTSSSCPLLPLEWTKINRRSNSSISKRQFQNRNQEGNNSSFLFCCENPTCRKNNNKNDDDNDDNHKNNNNNKEQQEKGSIAKKKNISDTTTGNPSSIDQTSSVKRKNNSSNTNYDDKSCNENKTKKSKIKTSSPTSAVNNDNDDDVTTIMPKNPKMISLNGKGLFCLHSFDSTWFQGHFIPSSSSTTSSSFGLLAIERNDVDQCLQCKDGGYKEIDLTILSSSSSTTTTTKNSNTTTSNYEKKQRRKLHINQLVCTGGDMLRITTTNNDNATSSSTTSISDNNYKNQNKNCCSVSFDADRIITGNKVESLVKKYFPTLVVNNKNENDNDGEVSGSVLDVLPDCAIVIGDMNICVPTSFVYGSFENYNDDDNDWME